MAICPYILKEKDKGPYEKPETMLVYCHNEMAVIIWAAFSEKKPKDKGIYGHE